MQELYAAYHSNGCSWQVLEAETEHYLVPTSKTPKHVQVG
jgi:hypothetical protein